MRNSPISSHSLTTLSSRKVAEIHSSKGHNCHGLAYKQKFLRFVVSRSHLIKNYHHARNFQPIKLLKMYSMYTLLVLSLY